MNSQKLKPYRADRLAEAKWRSDPGREKFYGKNRSLLFSKIGNPDCKPTYFSSQEYGKEGWIGLQYYRKALAEKGRKRETMSKGGEFKTVVRM